MSLQEKMPYDTLKDLVPVSLLTTTPFVMAAPLSSKANTAADVIAFAKQKRGHLSMGTAATARPCTSRRSCSTIWRRRHPAGPLSRFGAGIRPT